MKSLGAGATGGIILALVVLYWLPPVGPPAVAIVVLVCTGLTASLAGLVTRALGRRRAP
jgi:hypothetical protein